MGYLFAFFLKNISRRLGRKVTVVGESQARVGYAFVFNGPAEACFKCKYYKACLEGLEEGRVYAVRSVLDKALDCKLHSGAGRLVEIEEEAIEAAVEEKKAILGALIDFRAVECGNRVCGNRGLCNPVGLRHGDKCRVVKAGGKVICPLGFRLLSVRLQRLPSYNAR